MLGRTLKILHELGAIGVMGAIATCLVLVATAPTDPDAYAALRQSMVKLHSWLLVPSLLAVLVSGLLAIAANAAYKDAGWAWLKALLGLAMFEGSLLTIVAAGKRAATHSAAVAAGNPDAAAPLAEALRTEWGGLWVMFAISLANVVLGVWRPRFRRRRATVTS